MDSIVGLFLFLIFAVWQDYHIQKISNFYIISAFFYALLYQFIQNGIQGVGAAVIHTGILISFLFPLYLLKALGAGDVKLLGVTAAYLTWQLALQAFLTGIYLSLIPIFILCIRKGFCVKKIAMSGPIAGGILFVMYKEGCV